MMYFIEDVRDGSLVAVARSYALALVIQDQLWKDKGIDTYIR